jgi:peptidyl-prolyl cis-trans isomerase SurA
MGRNGIERGLYQIAKGALISAAMGVVVTSQLAFAETLVDRLLAEVNGEAILLSEVEEKVSKGPLEAVSAFPAGEDASEFEVALQDAINFKLIEQRAEELDITVTDERLEEEINRFLKRRQLSRPELMQALAQQGMTYDQYREDFRRQILLNQFQGREILPSVKITDKDLEIFYLNRTGNAADNLRLVLRQLFIRVESDGAESVQKGKKALVERIQEELKDGMPFAKAARVYSDHSSREDGGLMNPLYLRDLAPMIRNAVEDLNEGEFTAPVKTPMGYFFFYLESKEFAGSAEFEKLKPQLEGQLRQQEMARQTVRWLEEQRRRSEIRVIR